MCIFLPSGNQEIDEDNANIRRVGTGQFIPLTFRTLVSLYQTIVSYPSPSGWECTHIGYTYLIHIIYFGLF